MFKVRRGSSREDVGIEIDPAQLCVGLFVRLNLRWIEHNFMFNQFRIGSEAQIRALQALGLKRITYFPERSTAQPLNLPRTTVPTAPTAPDARPPAQSPPAPPAEAVAPAEGSDAIAGDTPPAPGTTVSPPAPDTPAAPDAPHPVPEKLAQFARLTAQRAEIARCEKRYSAAAAEVKSVMRNLFAAGGKAVETAHKLIGSMVDELPENGEIVIHLMNEKLAEETSYFHVLNVMVLSILLGRELKLPPDLLRVVGEAALLHDIGRQRIPEAVLHNEARNRHEEELFRMHTTYGREIAAKLEGLSPAALEVIELHHERIDGKGYPRGLAGNDIPLLARLVAVTNRYDELCNPISLTKARTPAEALGYMFRVESEAWDKTMLQAFIRLMGVYPPGSLVQLSNGNVALVVAVDHTDLLRPSVMIFDPTTPREDALVIDLISEPDVGIDMVLKPRDLDPAALAYLSPRRKMSYYHAPRQQ